MSADLELLRKSGRPRKMIAAGDSLNQVTLHLLPALVIALNCELLL